MGRCADDPVKHVISFRVTDMEKEALEDLAQVLGVNVSTFLRQKLNLLVEEANDGYEIQLKKPLQGGPFSS